MASITQILIDKLGFPWSLRVLCFLLLGVGLIGGLLIRQRITPNFRKPKTDGVKLLPKLDFSVFKNTYFLVLYISGGLGQFGCVDWLRVLQVKSPVDVFPFALCFCSLLLSLQILR